MTCQVLAKIRKNWNSHALLGRMQNGTATLENSWTVFAQLNVQLPYDFAILHLDIYCRELKMYVHTKTCMWIFIAPLFVITKIGNNPVSLNGLMDKQTLWHSYHGILFSSKKEQAIDTCSNMDWSQRHCAWVKNEVSKVSYWMIQFMWHFGKEKTIARTHQWLPMF